MFPPLDAALHVCCMYTYVRVCVSVVCERRRGIGEGYRGGKGVI